MDREAAVIRSEMSQTRADLDRKLSQLETRAKEMTPRALRPASHAGIPLGARDRDGAAGGGRLDGVATLPPPPRSFGVVRVVRPLRSSRASLVGLALRV